MAPPEAVQMATGLPRASLHGSDMKESLIPSELTNGAAAGPADVAQLLEQIKSMESRIKSLESTKVHDPTPPEPVRNQPSTGTKPDIKLTPRVRWCTWEEFKNYFGEDDGKDSIDVLWAGQQLADDVRQEVSRRVLAREQTSASAAEIPSFSSYGNEASWMRRIRIKSKIVLSILARISGKYGLYHIDADMPATFVEPFSSLIFVHEEFKSEVKLLEGNDSAGEGLEVENSGTEYPKAVVPTKPVTSDEREMLECYIKFMDAHIMPRYKQLRFGDAHEDFSKKVRFNDLWMLFQPGELVYVPPSSEVGKPRALTEQRVWRLYATREVESVWNFDEIEREQYSNLGRKKEKQDTEDGQESDAMAEGLELGCYYLDYTGTTFCPVHRTFTIFSYEGEVDITSLKAYPLRFLPQKKTVLSKLRDEREQFVKYTKGRHQLLYEGWSLVKDVRGRDISPDITHPEYIDSEVIIDFEESFQSHPHWKPNFFWSVYRGNPATKWKIDYFSLIHWKDRKRSSVISEKQDLCQIWNGLCIIETNRYAQNDRFITLAAYVDTSEPPKHNELCGDEILLLPTRIFAYSLRDRRFFQIDVRYLKEIKQVQDPFSSLQIDPGHKDTIESLLYTHFEKKILDRSPGPDIPDQDLIRGKGRGSVFLLHGAPGVGKTATAEAVAQKYGKPLFSISCGDLGYQPDKVESALTEIFRLAQVWDCILLLDEADVFLTQRYPNDLKRNAMVSTILRILEYYKGVLFLTTNRPGVLDEALKSRVHVSLHYPSLNLEKMQQIFRINLERLVLIEERRGQHASGGKLVVFQKEILDYASTHYQRYGNGLGSWNGRQIRNAFQIASSMARYDGTKVEGAQAQLHASHFERVAAATYSYDQFRKQTLRKGDAELARSLNHRDDTYGMPTPHVVPDNISYHGQPFGAPAGVQQTHPNFPGQPSNLAPRNFAPYAPGQGLSGFPEHHSQTAAQPGSASSAGPQLQGTYSGPSAFQN